MIYKNTPNLLLESISYLCRKASGDNWDKFEAKIKDYNLEDNILFLNTFTKLKLLTTHISNTVSLNKNILNKFFKNIEGFSFNTIGSTSIAFLLFYNVLEEYNDDLDTLIEKMKDFTDDEIAYNILQALDLSDKYTNENSISPADFINRISTLSIPAESQLTILNAYSNYRQYLGEIYSLINPVITVLEKERETLEDIISNFNLEISRTGAFEFFKEISTLKPINGIEYIMYPFIFGMDTNLATDKVNNTINIYCGILRKELLSMINDNTSPAEQVYKAYHILGDRTRFDILCYLNTHRAYGQELSSHFKLSRNTIHHHMNKLVNSGFVTCTTDGKRVYYSVNTAIMKKLLKSQKELFLQNDI